MLDTLDTSDCAEVERRPVHQPGVEFDGAGAGEHGAASGVEGPMPLQYGDSFCDDIQGRCALQQQRPTARERLPQAVAVRLGFVLRDVPGATVDEQPDAFGAGGRGYRITAKLHLS